MTIKSISVHQIMKQSANGFACWFGARWFGFLESPYERDCYLGVPLESQTTNPNQQLTISWNNKPLNNYLCSKLLRHHPPQKQYKRTSTTHMFVAWFKSWNNNNNNNNNNNKPFKESLSFRILRDPQKLREQAAVPLVTRLEVERCCFQSSGAAKCVES